MKKKHIAIVSALIAGSATVIAAIIARSGGNGPPPTTESSTITSAGLTPDATATTDPEDHPDLGNTTVNPVCNAGWAEFDDPEWSPDKQDTGLNEGWRGGKPNGNGGVGEGQYYLRSKYAYASEEQGWDQSSSIAIWNLGRRSGPHEIEAHIPPDHATATASYHLYRGDELIGTEKIDQQHEKGWVELWNHVELEESGQDYTIRLNFYDSKPSADTKGPAGQSVAMDAIRVRCLNSG